VHYLRAAAALGVRLAVQQAYQRVNRTPLEIAVPAQLPLDRGACRVLGFEGSSRTPMMQPSVPG
jgi:hypothetical protein